MRFSDRELWTIRIIMVLIVLSFIVDNTMTTSKSDRLLSESRADAALYKEKSARLDAELAHLRQRCKTVVEAK